MLLLLERVLTFLRFGLVLAGEAERVRPHQHPRPPPAVGGLAAGRRRRLGECFRAPSVASYAELILPGFLIGITQ